MNNKSAKGNFAENESYRTLLFLDEISKNHSVTQRHHSFLFYKEARKKLFALFTGLSQKGVRDVVFYGAGELAEIAYLTLQETPLRLIAVVDDHKNGRWFLKYRVEKPLCLKELNYDRVIVTSIRSMEEIVERLKKLNVRQNKIEVLNE